MAQIQSYIDTLKSQGHAPGSPGYYKAFQDIWYREGKPVVYYPRGASQDEGGIYEATVRFWDPAEEQQRQAEEAQRSAYWDQRRAENEQAKSAYGGQRTEVTDAPVGAKTPTVTREQLEAKAKYIQSPTAQYASEQSFQQAAGSVQQYRNVEAKGVIPSVISQETIPEPQPLQQTPLVTLGAGVSPSQFKDPFLKIDTRSPEYAEKVRAENWWKSRSPTQKATAGFMTLTQNLFSGTADRLGLQDKDTRRFSPLTFEPMGGWQLESAKISNPKSGKSSEYKFEPIPQPSNKGFGDFPLLAYRTLEIGKNRPSGFNLETLKYGARKVVSENEAFQTAGAVLGFGLGLGALSKVAPKAASLIGAGVVIGGVGSAASKVATGQHRQAFIEGAPFLLLAPQAKGLFKGVKAPALPRISLFSRSPAKPTGYSLLSPFEKTNVLRQEVVSAIKLKKSLFRSSASAESQKFAALPKQTQSEIIRTETIKKIKSQKISPFSHSPAQAPKFSFLPKELQNVQIRSELIATVKPKSGLTLFRSSPAKTPKYSYLPKEEQALTLRKETINRLSPKRFSLFSRSPAKTPAFSFLPKNTQARRIRAEMVNKGQKFSLFSRSPAKTSKNSYRPKSDQQASLRSELIKQAQNRPILKLYSGFPVQEVITKRFSSQSSFTTSPKVGWSGVKTFAPSKTAYFIPHIPLLNRERGRERQRVVPQLRKSERGLVVVPQPRTRERVRVVPQLRNRERERVVTGMKPNLSFFNTDVQSDKRDLKDLIAVVPALRTDEGSDQLQRPQMRLQPQPKTRIREKPQIREAPRMIPRPVPRITPKPKKPSITFTIRKPKKGKSKSSKFLEITPVSLPSAMLGRPRTSTKAKAKPKAKPRKQTRKQTRKQKTNRRKHNK